MNWIALFSQTGTELLNLIKLGHHPSYIYTNSRNINSNLIKVCEKINIPIKQISKSPKVEEYNKIFKDSNIVTLHGFLRIIPNKVCDQYNIFNLHPALINKFPELKGIDPQIRTFNGNYKEVGCVIHKVIGKVDSGRIILWNKDKFNSDNINDLYNLLAKKALILWDTFLQRRFKENESSN